MREEVIDFREFMKGKNTNRKTKDIILRSSFIGAITLKSLLDLSPMMSMAYTGVILLGGTAISLGLLENKYAKNGKHVEADRVSTFGGMLFPVMFMGSLVFFCIFAYRTLML